MENRYVFILCPPASGSTLLHKILQTSPHTSAFKGEGQALVKEILFTKDRWNPGKVIPWNIVKEKWHEKWDLTKPILLEKSPPHLVRAKQLETYFPGSYFLIMMRNPYAFCEGVKRRWENRATYLNIAKFWILCARYQIDNIKRLKNALWFTYETLTENPSGICSRLLDFLPELESLDIERRFGIFEKSMRITNLDAKQIAGLSADHIFEIDRVLKKNRYALDFFNYPFIDPPAGAVRFKTIKKIQTRLRSLNHVPDPLRWQKS